MPGPVAVVPRMRIQPVAASDVATHSVELAVGEPRARTADREGPDVHDRVDLARQVSHARGLGRRIVPVRVPGCAGRAMTDGSLLPAHDGPRGEVRFADWLAEDVGRT